MSQTQMPPRESEPAGVVAPPPGSRVRILETVLRIAILTVSLLHVLGILVFLNNTGFDLSGMQDVLGGAGMAKLLLVPLVFLLGGILFAFRRPESVWVFTGYLVFWILQAPFAGLAFSALSHSLVALALLQALKDALRGGVWAPSGALGIRVKEFVLKQDRGPWWVLSFAVLNLYGFLTVDLPRILEAGSGVVPAEGIAFSVGLGLLVLAGAIALFLRSKPALPLLGAAVAVAALWWVFQEDSLALVPVVWTSLLLVYAYLKPSLDAWVDGEKALAPPTPSIAPQGVEEPTA